MLVIVSPAKKLDFESENLRGKHTQPALISDTRQLAAEAKKLKAGDLKKLMGISDALADLNAARFKAFNTPFTPANARPAIDAFKGDVYVGLDAPTLSDDDIAFAQDHLRILSGLYGLLKPLDLMQAYRLEMGIRFENSRGTNLYQFWGDKITKTLNKDLSAQDEPELINLASGEYFKAVKSKLIKGRIISPAFKEIRDGQLKIISFSAKKARGLMARYIIDHRITKADQLKAFDLDGYRFNEERSGEDEWVFIRPKP